MFDISWLISSVVGSATAALSLAFFSVFSLFFLTVDALLGAPPVGGQIGVSCLRECGAGAAAETVPGLDPLAARLVGTDGTDGRFL